MFEIKNITTIGELEQIQALETEVWNIPPIPTHQTFTAINNGGMALGAYENERLIGFLYGFPGFRNGYTYLCSHMLGISPDYRKSGVGEALKLKQKEVAANMGYSLIVWTYDPLESVNAYLNLHKLSGVVRTCYENYYQTMDDKLNKGLPTDRFLVEWWINSEYRKEKKETIEWSQGLSLIETYVNKNTIPAIQKLSLEKLSDGNIYLVPIPENIQEVKTADMNAALEWRLTTRQVFQALISKGYVAADIIRRKDEQLSYYVFKKKEFISIPDKR